MDTNSDDYQSLTQSDILFQIDYLKSSMEAIPDEEIVTIAEELMMEFTPEIDISNSTYYFFSKGKLSREHRDALVYYIIFVEIPFIISESGQLKAQKKYNFKKLF